MARKRSRETHAYRWFHYLLKILLGPIFLWFYRLRGQNVRLVKRLAPPFLVIPNHVMTYDPLLVSYYIPDPVYFVASDANFRNSFFSWWIRHVGAIPKSKLMDDFATLRTVMRLLKEGKLVGLFAEGQRTWDGSTQPIIASTAKLVKMAKVPVVVPVLKGAFLSLPRFAFRSRRGTVIIEFRFALTAEQVRELPPEEIHKRIEATMRHDEDEFQRGLRRPYTFARAAETLQLVLFWCPHCKALNTTYGEGRRFFCRACGYSVRYTAFGWFRRDHDRTLQTDSTLPTEPIHTTIGEWSRAQHAFIEPYLRRQLAAGRREALFSDEPVTLLTGYRMASLNPVATGTLALYVDRLSFTDQEGSLREFPLAEVRALNVVYQDQVEFYFNRTLCVFRFPQHDTSGYKYLVFGEKLQQWSTLTEEPTKAL